MKLKRTLIIMSAITACNMTYSQSVSFSTYINPVIPGDHPDPTLTKVGDDFYTSGSSFNPTPKIYHSTDLVHWEVITQPVSASWSQYGDRPGGGIWGGHMVLYNGKYWHFFGRGGGPMYFVTADQPEGPWSSPTQMQVPSGLSGLGVDNSIFIDEATGKWYLLTKAGRENNHILELRNNGQPAGKVFDFTWLNPAPDYPYSWAEGPVMWKHDGYYFYSFAQHLAGSQYVMRSDTLTDEESAWTVIAESIFTGSRGTYNTPNHIAPVVELEDGTSWTIAQSYNSNAGWYAQGRQGLLCKVTYNEDGFPEMQYPPNTEVDAPDLPCSGIPWMVPKSDMFNSPELKPEWSFLGYTPSSSYSLTEREGWLYLEPYTGSNTIIQNDGEHNYSLITRVEFEPESVNDEAGLWIINGPQTHTAKVYCSVNESGQKIAAFVFDRTPNEEIYNGGSAIWLKLEREDHSLSGYFSSDGLNWTKIGITVDASALDIEQTQFNNFTGNQQGLYVEGKGAYFDLYVYRDAYTDIAAKDPANRFGVNPSTTYLGNIENDDWAMYAGVEFGNNDYNVTPVSLEVEAASSTSGGLAEVWLDSIGTGRKISEVTIENTGGRTSYETFYADVDEVSGSHDVYLSFKGDGADLFRIRKFKFVAETVTAIDQNDSQSEHPGSYKLGQNYPNPFNPATRINYSVSVSGSVTMKVYDIAGNEIATLVNEHKAAGNYETKFDGFGFASGVYLYRMQSANFSQTKKFIMMK